MARTGDPAFAGLTFRGGSAAPNLPFYNIKKGNRCARGPFQPSRGASPCESRPGGSGLEFYRALSCTLGDAVSSRQKRRALHSVRSHSHAALTGRFRGACGRSSRLVHLGEKVWCPRAEALLHVKISEASFPHTLLQCVRQHASEIFPWLRVRDDRVAAAERHCAVRVIHLPRIRAGLLRLKRLQVVAEASGSICLPSRHVLVGRGD